MKQPMGNSVAAARSMNHKTSKGKTFEILPRFALRRILVPFDLSNLSQAAWQRAVAIARRFNSEIEALFVQEWPLGENMALMPPPDFAPEYKKKLINRIRETVGEDAKISLVVGNAAEQILHFAKIHRADLIVMGTHGRTGLKRALVGSVTEAVAQNSSVPVLAVRGEESEFRSVLAPIHFTDYSYFGFMYAAAFAVGMGLPLTALHVHVDPVWEGNPLKKLEEFIEGLPEEVRRSCSPLVENGKDGATDGIIHAGEKHDLIVLAAHEKSTIKEMVLGMTAARVLRAAQSSVLIVPAMRKRLPLRKNLPTPCCATS